MNNFNLEKDDIDLSLEQIQDLVNRLFCEPLNVAKVFGSRKLDDACQEIGRRNLLGIHNHGNSFTKSDVAVYIASKLQASGGHTAALLDVIRLSPHSPSVVIVTDTCGRTNRDVAEDKFRSLNNVSLEFVPHGNLLSKLSWLQKRLLEIGPNTVWLFNHHQDSVAIAAVQPNLGYRVKFYHHGDDRLCLGVYLKYAEHYDPLLAVFHNCRDVLGINGNRYLPLVVSDQGRRSDEPRLSNRAGLVTCTVGRFNKVEIDYPIRYVDVVPHILATTGGTHVHIGRLTPIALWRIRRGLRKAGVSSYSFMYIPHVPSVWQALHEYDVDVYIASFPYGGGRTLVEVMGAGIPAVVHRHCSNRMIGGFDMAYDEAITWRDPEELYAFLRGADRERLEAHGRLARDWYEKYHHDDIAREALSTSDWVLGMPRLRADYCPDSLMDAWQTSREVTLSGFFYRKIFRNYRHWASVLGRYI